MILTTQTIRRSILAGLDGNITYKGQSIRVFEEYLMETKTKKKAILPGNVEAYIILLNQTSNEARSNKCNRINDDSLQIQVTTVFPAGKGGSEYPEDIANIILSILFPTNYTSGTVDFPNGLSLFNIKLLGTRNINYDGNSSRTWITQLIVESWISQ